MKAFLHLTDRRTSKTLNALWAEMDLEGEALFWRFLELVAGAYGPPDFSTSFEINSAVFRHHLPVSKRKLDRFLKILSEQNDIKMTVHGQGRAQLFKIEYPKIARMADEYTRKARRSSGQYPDHGRTMSGHVSGQSPDIVSPNKLINKQMNQSSSLDEVANTGNNGPDNGNGVLHTEDSPVDHWGGIPQWFLDDMQKAYPLRYNYVTPSTFTVQSAVRMMKSFSKDRIRAALRHSGESGGRSLGHAWKILETSTPRIPVGGKKKPEKAQVYMVVNTKTEQVRQITNLDKMTPDEEVL